MSFMTVMEWIGTVAFAVSGSVLAIKRDLDYYGICFMAIITAIGGGIIRDIILRDGLPVGIENPMYALVSLLTALVVIVFYKKILPLEHLFSIADGIGLAAFTAIGAKVAVLNGEEGIYVITIMAVLTGTFGGVLRDVCSRETPVCFRKDIYAVASIIGGMVFYAIEHYTGSMNLALYFTFGVTLGIRLLAIYKNLHLGRVRIEDEDNVSSAFLDIF